MAIDMVGETRWDDLDRTGASGGSDMLKNESCEYHIWVKYSGQVFCSRIGWPDDSLG